MRSLNQLAWRNLQQQRTRTILSALAVALGVMMIVASGMITSALRNTGETLERSGSTAGIVAGQMESGLTMIGAVIVAAAGFLIFNAFAMSVTQRRQQIGVMRSLGMTRRQVMNLIINEALLTGGGGTLLGMAAGPFFGWGLLSVMRAAFNVTHGNPDFNPANLLLAAGMGIGITLLAVIPPARRATRISPLVALRDYHDPGEGEARRGRLAAWIGVLILTGLTACLIIAPPGYTLTPPTAGIVTGIFMALWLSGILLITPALIGIGARIAQALLSRQRGAIPRLMADNLGRDRSRVTLTVLTMAVGLMMIVTLAGMILFQMKMITQFFNNYDDRAFTLLFALTGVTEDNWASLETISSIDVNALEMPPEVLEDLDRQFGDDIDERMNFWILMAPEVEAVPGVFSYMMDAEELQTLGLYEFYEGDWEHALPIMQSECGVLVVPSVAADLGVDLYETFTLNTPNGEIKCTIAGTGTNFVMGTTIFGMNTAPYYNIPADPVGILLRPKPGLDEETFIAEMHAFGEKHGILVFSDMNKVMKDATGLAESLIAILNGPLLLAVLAAALGVINTTMMSVSERRQELGLLRAVGATKKQVRRIVAGEAALMGLLGGIIGIAAGIGLVAIRVLVGGGSEFGVVFDDLWLTAWELIRPTLLNGLVALIAAPLISAWAATIPVRRILRGSAIDTLEEARIPHHMGQKENRQMINSLYALAWRNLSAQRTRTILNISAVALGVAITIAGNVAGRSIINSLSDAAEVQAVIRGLLDQFNGTLTAIGVAITAAAGFIIFNAFMMTITQRRQQIGTLRSLGMMRRQVLRVTLTEALLVGGIGTLVGLAGGPLLGVGVIALARAFVGDFFTFKTSNAAWWAYLLAVVMGIGITFFAVLIPARMAARISPLVAMRDQAAGDDTRIKWLLPVTAAGGLLLAGMLGWLAIAPPGEWLMPPQDLIWMIGFIGAWLLALILLLPVLIEGVGRRARRPLTRRWGAVGRLIADNLRRGRGRVTLTILSLTLSLTMIAGLNGFMGFAFNELFYPKIHGSIESSGWQIAPFDYSTGMSGYGSLEDLALPPELIAELPAVIDGRADVVEWQFLIVPELSFFGSTYTSFMLEPVHMRDMGGNGWMFTFMEGDWEHAMPILESGCGILVTPTVAAKNNVALYDWITVTGANGPVECQIAGIGGTYVNATLIGLSAKEQFGLGDPFMYLISPRPGEDRDQLETDLEDFLDAYPGTYLIDSSQLAEVQAEMFDMVPRLFTSILILALIAAALGVVNTIMMGVTERRRELGLLRALGATRRQVIRVVVGEAALMGIIGGVLGLVAGPGVVGVIVLVYGGNGWGLPELELWPAAIRSMGRVLPTALLGLVAAPLVSALAAYFPARSILRGAAIDTLDPERRPDVLEHKEPKRGLMMRSLNFLALRHLEQERTRSILSALAVLLGVAMTIASDQIGRSLLDGMTQTEDLRLITEGLTKALNLFMMAAGVAITVAAGFIIFNAFMMSVTQRRQQIGALRSLGMTRRQVMRLVTFEALIVGGLGTLAGMIAGPLLGRGMIVLSEATGGDIFPFEAAAAKPGIVLLAGALGIGISLLSVYFPARGATRISPLEALREHQSEIETSTRRAVWLHRSGIIIIVTLAAWLIIAPPGEWALPPASGRLLLLFSVLFLVAVGLTLPALVGGVAWLGRRILPWLWGANGRLIADNLGRSRNRVTLTVVTLGLGVALIVSLTGFYQFIYNNMFGQFALQQEIGIQITAFDLTGDPSSYSSQESLRVTPEVKAAVQEEVNGRADMHESSFAIVPELSLFGDSFFSLVVDPHQIRSGGDKYFTLTEGSWDQAMPIMEAGCGVLVTPAVAVKNEAGLYDTITVTGTDGPVECTIAGIGSSPQGGASLISSAAKEDFGATDPYSLIIYPRAGVDVERLKADLQELADRYPNVYLTEQEGLVEQQAKQNATVLGMMNAMLSLAVVAAALGVVNTTVMSVHERRRELGLLRALGSTRQQIMMVIVGEAALMGIVGGLAGMLVGLGITIFMPVVFGGRALGVELDVWRAAGEAILPTLTVGFSGVLITPVVSALAAYLPTRAVTRGTPIETLEPARIPQITARQRAFAWLSRGSIRLRFALGTGLLMTIILAGLIAVVTGHARTRVTGQTHDALQMMVGWNAGMLEVALDEETENLDFDRVQEAMGSMGGMGGFDTESLLRFESLLDDLTANGLESFYITDRQNIIILSLDQSEMGTLAAPLEDITGVTVVDEKVDGEWRIHSTAPVRNKAGLVVGSVRLTANAREIQDFLRDLRRTLWAAGLVIVAMGMALSWQIGHYAADPQPGGLLNFLPVRMRLTLALVAMTGLMVGLLQLIAIPVLEERIESVLQDGMIAGAEWFGGMISDSFDSDTGGLSDLSGLEGMSIDNLDSLAELPGMMQNLDVARLQTLGEQMQSEDLAYIALLDEDGFVLVSDQLSVIGRQSPVPRETRLDKALWQGEEIWIISTPLRKGRDGEQVGAFQMGVHRRAVDDFLNESRTIFRLSGVIAILMGLLLAQVIGEAVVYRPGTLSPLVTEVTFPINPGLVGQVVAQHQAGYTPDQIAGALGVTVAQVYAVLAYYYGQVADR